MTSTHLWRVWFGEAPIHGPFTRPVKGIRVSFQPILCAPASYNFNTVFGHECCIQFKIISCCSLVWGTAVPLFLSMATMVCDCLCHCRVESFRCHPHFCILYGQSCELIDSCAYIVDLVVFTTVLHQPSLPPPFSTTDFHHHSPPPIFTTIHHHHSPPPIFPHHTPPPIYYHHPPPFFTPPSSTPPLFFSVPSLFFSVPPSTVFHFFVVSFKQQQAIDLIPARGK